MTLTERILTIKPPGPSRAALMTSTAAAALTRNVAHAPNDARRASLQIVTTTEPRAERNPPNKPGLIVTCAADVEPQPIDWLWPQRLAIGKLSMIAGQPGLGKSQLTAFLAAVVSTGGNWPCAEGAAERGDVLMLSAEDDLADTIRPRLEAAGADLDRVHVIEAAMTDDGRGQRGFSLAADLDKLADFLARNGNVRLVTVDPITAYLGGVDTHRTSDVRASLAPLQALAQKYRVAVVAISHLNKGGTTGAMNRVTGSLAFVAAARAAFIVAREPESDRRLFLPAKNNLGNDSTGCAFKVEQRDLGHGIVAPMIVWDRERVTVTADEALAASEATEDRSSKSEAMAFLRDMLADKPLSARDVKRMAAEAGISDKALRTARETIGIKPVKAGFGTTGGWVWELPAEAARS